MQVLLAWPQLYVIIRPSLISGCLCICVSFASFAWCLYPEQAQASPLRKAHEDSRESLSSLPHRDTMGTFLPDSSAYELLTKIASVRKASVEKLTEFLFVQEEIHVSKLFHHPSILPYKSIFISENQLWVITPFMAYGSARDLISTHFTHGLNELAIAYILLGVLRALEYIHHNGYVHRSVKASHILISADGQVYLSGLRSIFSLIRHGQRARVVHDFPQYSVKVLPWLSPEVLQQNLQGYDFRSDIYSLGITACELANGHMLLEKLNGMVPCLLDSTTIPAEELGMKSSRSGADSGICEGPGAGGARHTNGEANPYNRTFSPHFHNFVELCLQRDPEKRPYASTLITHSFFKQIKRRACEALPELLRPVSPLGRFECVRPQDSPSALASLESSLSHLDVDDWDF
ncbi:STE20-related kinase adapter protein alpha [Bagarius yarrelli]|uniref:STE20-related kinase adapter protein alpha n=1 Tax=Bagarius yarrelli TaxID=175774 RepID=A0A556UZG2_BAGYA|nr:STE20-related kinase adapter protein alpha [Bagarius yarrelli]